MIEIYIFMVIFDLIYDISFTLPTCPSERRTLIPCGWYEEFVSISLTFPSVSFPLLWSFFSTILTKIPGVILLLCLASVMVVISLFFLFIILDRTEIFLWFAEILIPVLLFPYSPVMNGIGVIYPGNAWVLRRFTYLHPDVLFSATVFSVF